jgi:hypothetical protein
MELGIKKKRKGAVKKERRRKGKKVEGRGLAGW